MSKLLYTKRFLRRNGYSYKNAAMAMLMSYARSHDDFCERANRLSKYLAKRDEAQNQQT